jgi:hypothetical protein
MKSPLEEIAGRSLTDAPPPRAALQWPGWRRLPDFLAAQKRMNRRDDAKRILRSRGFDELRIAPPSG